MELKCGHHPDRDATGGTCNRCGTYLCGECVVPDAEPILCTTCLRHLDAGPHLRHVRIVAVLFVIHGLLLAGMGLYYLLFGGFVLDALADIPASGTGDATEDMLPELIFGTMALIGLTQVGPGVLQALAGWLLFGYRHPRVAWLGAAFGIIAVFGCYCAPTALALLGYAAWVLSREDVRARLATGVPPKKATA